MIIELSDSQIFLHRYYFIMRKMEGNSFDYDLWEVSSIGFCFSVNFLSLFVKRHLQSPQKDPSPKQKPDEIQTETTRIQATHTPNDEPTQELRTFLMIALQEKSEEMEKNV